MIRQKRGQFYLIAVLVIASMIIAIITVTNFVKVSGTNRVSELSKQIPLEKNYVLDYIVNKNLNSSEAQKVLDNFSNMYVGEIGTDKDIFFIAGTNKSIDLIGNRASNDSVFYDVGNGFQNLTDKGRFTKTMATNGSISIKLPEGTYSFLLYPGQNLYYLIKYNYSNEVYVEHD